MQECHTLYTEPDHGLVSIAETLNLKLLAPRKKITIMLIGKSRASNPVPPLCSRSQTY